MVPSLAIVHLMILFTYNETRLTFTNGAKKRTATGPFSIG
jgi:hypothetical protein